MQLSWKAALIYYPAYMKNMGTTSRIVIAAGSLLLMSVYFLPFWSIYLIAPQYPEGLSMQIWLYKLTGQVDIINGLNHYIGMKHIKAEMFPEFDLLVYVFGAYIVLGLVVAFIGSRKLLTGYLILFVIGGIAALVDFYKWGFDYGHNLDPHAAIQVPGLSYQPPLVGHKKLLNFDAFSYPDTGGWVVTGVVALFFIVLFIEWRKWKRMDQSTPGKKKTLIAMTWLALLFITGCTPKPEKITVGKDACAECKMTIMDPKFAGEIVTKKGKVFKFDDAHCLATFLKHRRVELSDLHQTLLTNYDNANQFIKVNNAEFVLSSKLKSPMGGNAAAFPNAAAAEKKSAALENSKVTNWSTLYNILVK